MISQAEGRVRSILRSYVNMASIITFGVGLTVIFGWLLNVPILKTFLPSLPAMRFNTGLSFFLLGGSLWFLRNEAASPVKKRIGNILAGLVLALSLLTLSEYLFVWNLGIDELFVKDLASPLELFPGRIAPIAVFSLGFCSVSLLMLGSRISYYFSITVIILSFAGIMSYQFNFEVLHSQQLFTYTAIHASVTFLLISLGVILARPTSNMVQMLSSNQTGSRAFRLLLPGIILFTILMGWVVEWLQGIGLLDTNQESIFLVILLIFVYSPLIYFIGMNTNKAEEALRTSEEQYRTLFNRIPVALYRTSPQGQILDANSALVEMLGYPDFETLSKINVGEIYVTPEDRARENVELIQAGIVWGVEFEVRCFDGRVITVQDKSRIVKDADGNVVFFEGSLEDITQRKQAEIERGLAERELIENEARYRQAIAAASAIPYSLDYATNQYLFLGEGIFELTGYPVNEFTPLLLESLIKESIMQGDYAGTPMLEAVRQVRNGEGGLLWNCEHRFITRSGEERWLSDASIQILGEDGLPKGSVGIFQDITDRKQAEERIMDLARFPEENPYPVLRASRNGRIIYANPGSYTLLQEWKCEVGGDLPLIWKDLIAKLVETDSKETVEVHCGELIYAITLTPMRDRGYVNLYGRDITERERAEKQLRGLNTQLENRVAERTLELNQTNAELEHANRAKDEFLAIMSHELRTPLNSILGLSESLLEQRSESLSERQQKFMQIIESNGHHLLTLINDILDLSKIEAGKFDYYPESIEVNGLCRSGLSFVKEQAIRKSITLTYEEDKTVSSIYADPRRLKQILVNLLTNAVKFTPEHGKVTLQVKANAKDDLIQFSITDSGIGIAREDLKRLFRPFIQVDSKLNRQFEGTGLGLALVQKLADLHGGSVYVESEVGVGSCFTISIPWGKEIMAQQENARLGGGLPARIISEALEKTSLSGVVLLAEDNMANTLTVGEYLESHGYEVVNAHDGLEAVQMAEKTKPDIILMDIQMPVMDGLEAIHRLRAIPRFASTPIIALTALAMPGDRERCIEAGANEYMSKPVSLRQLAGIINDFMGRA
ncbi:MAG TPA: ATP-binding protein [Anaerolineales bacterium]|nr:ATP-binding protein [Anaerolineales bacterium]